MPPNVICAHGLTLRELISLKEKNERNAPMFTTTKPIIIRPATHADGRTLRDLALLDSRKPMSDRALIAEIDGRPKAALDLTDGSVAADPFAPTAELVELLHLRAATLMSVSPPARHRGRVSRPARLARLAGARS
jgi:hypothetical protein